VTKSNKACRSASSNGNVQRFFQTFRVHIPFQARLNSKVVIDNCYTEMTTAFLIPTIIRHGGECFAGRQAYTGLLRPNFITENNSNCYRSDPGKRCKASYMYRVSIHFRIQNALKGRHRKNIDEHAWHPWALIRNSRPLDVM